MPPYAAFHRGLHCLPKYLFTGIQNAKGFRSCLNIQDKKAEVIVWFVRLYGKKHLFDLESELSHVQTQKAPISLVIALACILTLRIHTCTLYCKYFK